MLAEMYLDLLNITESNTIPKRILSPLAKKLPKSVKRVRPKKSNWNNDNTITYGNNQTFKLNTSSIFNSPNNKSSRNKTSSTKRNKRSENSKSKKVYGDKRNITRGGKITN